MANRRGRIYRRTTKDPITGERVDTGPYWIQFWFNGKDRRESTHSMSVRVAEKLLTKRVAGKDAGTLDEANLKSKRFEDLEAAITRDYRLNDRASFDRMQDAFHALASKFAGWKTSAITDTRLSEYVDERLAMGRAHATILYELRVLKYAFRLTKVPCPDFPTIVPNNVRQDWFSQEEFRAVVDRLPVYLQPVMTAAYLMGWRTQSELLPLQWKHVDFTSGLITLSVGSTKNGEGREYPIGQFPELLALFQSRWETTQQLQRTRGVMIPWVFYRVTRTAVRPIKSYKTAWVNARNKAGLAGRRVHDFRRCSARSLRQAGVPESVCMSLLGHKTPSMFRRYSIVDNRDLRVGVAQLAAFYAQQAEVRDTYGTILPLPKVQGGGTHG